MFIDELYILHVIRVSEVTHLQVCVLMIGVNTKASFITSCHIAVASTTTD